MLVLSSSPSTKFARQLKELAGDYVLAMVLESGVWKHCGSKKARSSKQINEKAEL
jgi:hypothetical protein